MIETPVLKHALSYIAGFIFIIAIAAYIYLLIHDRKENTIHSQEENFWIYLFLALLILGFFSSYYLIRKSNEKVIELQNSFKGHKKIEFIGKNPRININGKGPLRNDKTKI